MKTVPKLIIDKDDLRGIESTLHQIFICLNKESIQSKEVFRKEIMSDINILLENAFKLGLIEGSKINK